MDEFNLTDDANAALTILDAEDTTLPVGDPPAVDNKEDEPLPEKEHEETEETDEEREAREKADEEEAAAKPEESKVTPIHRRPSVKDINAKYPNFFKEFPDMRHMLFREGEYSSLFPTVDDAKTAADDAESFSHLRSLVTSGTPEDFRGFLKGVDQEPGALPKMASNFLPSLFETNRELYYKVTQPVAVSLLRNAFKVGQSGNENLMNAALVLSKWAFDDQAFATGERQADPVVTEKPKDPTLERERNEFMTQKYQDTQSYVGSQGRSRMRAEVARGFDPNNALPDYTRNLLIDRVIEEVGAELEKDTRHMATINNMWKKAHQAGFAGDWKDRILATYLSGARTVMPAVRARVRKAALGDIVSTAEKTETQARKGEERREIRGSSNATGPRTNGRVATAAEVDWSKTSDLDFLNDKVTLKRKSN